MKTNTNQKHTPGRWYLRHDGWYDGLRTVTSKHRDIVQLDGGVNDDCETFANARLIAAAPELLDALDRIASGEFANDVSHQEQVAALRKVARDAIAKAEGRDQ